MSETCHEAMQNLRAFMFDRVYGAMSAKIEETKARRLLETLFSFYEKMI